MSEHSGNCGYVQKGVPCDCGLWEQSVVLFRHHGRIADLEAKLAEAENRVKEWEAPLKTRIIALETELAFAVSGYEDRIEALIVDCDVMCTALKRIEAGERKPRMIARRTLEHWSEKAALATAETEVKP